MPHAKTQRRQERKWLVAAGLTPTTLIFAPWRLCVRSPVSRWTLLPCFALAILALGGSARGEGLDIPAEHHRWGRFPPGSWVRLRTTQFTRGPDDTEQVQSVTHLTMRLEEVHDDGVTLVVEEAVEGQPVAGETQRRGWDDLPAETERTLRLSVGEVKLARRTFACQTHEITTGEAGAQTVTKWWYTSDVWPHVLKRTVRTSGALKRFASFEVVELDAQRDVLGEPRRGVRCRTVETTDAAASETIAFLAPDVPGELVHSETERRDKRTGAIEFVRVELEAFEVADRSRDD
jgi:hypothetical protein